MNWLLISALGSAAWTSVLVLVVAVCRTAAWGDEIVRSAVAASRGSGSAGHAPTPCRRCRATTGHAGHRIRRARWPAGPGLAVETKLAVLASPNRARHLVHDADQVAVEGLGR